jgi:hypothetical protein
MKEIALRYSNTKLTDLTFSDTAENQELFMTLNLTEPVIATTEETGVCLTGRKYNHLLYKHKEFEVVISSDEIVRDYLNDTLEFLQNFWTARFKYVSFFKYSAWGNYVQVMTEGGKFPLSNVDDLRDFPEVSFNLSYANPGN